MEPFIEPWSIIICNMYIIFTPIYMYGAPILLLQIYINLMYFMVSMWRRPVPLAATAVRPIISFHMLLFDFSRIIQFCLLHKHTRILLFSSVSELHFWLTAASENRAVPRAITLQNKK